MNQYTFYESNVRKPDEIIIGSCDIPVIIKTRNSKIKKSQYELWEEKTGKVKSFKGNEYTTWGNRLEPILLSAFIEKEDKLAAHCFLKDYIKYQYHRPKKYFPSTEFFPFTECKHPQFPWAIAHSDCIYNPDLLELSYPYSIEAKTGGYFARVGREGMEGFSLEDHTEKGVPSDVLLQVQWQMLCYDVDLTYVLLLIDDNKFHVYQVPAYKKWFPLMLEKASDFYQHCISNTPPKPEKYDDIKKLFPEIKDKVIYVTGERAIIAETMKEEKKKLQKKIKKYQNRVDDIKNAAGLLMGDNKFLYNGETGLKVFQQVITKDQYNMIHPSTIKKFAPEAFKILEKAGLINKSDRRYVR
jgi:predicted phage-related endonuclease